MLNGMYQFRNGENRGQWRGSNTKCNALIQEWWVGWRNGCQMWLSCSPLSRLLLFSWAWMWMASRTFLFHRLGSVSLTFAPSQLTWCCASHAWTAIPLLVSPRFTASLCSVILFFNVLPVSPMYRLSHSCKGSRTLLLSSWGQGWESSLGPGILWGC